MNINKFNRRYKTQSIGDDILAGDSSLYVSRLPRELPNKFTQYDKSSTDLAIIIPLFARYKNTRNALENVASVKYAMWSYWSLQRNTNIFESNIPVLFYIEDILYETHADYFKRLGLKETDFILFTPKPDTEEESKFYHHYRCNLGLCQLPIIDSQLQHFERILILDADLFFCKTSHAQDFHNILSITDAVPPDKIGLLGIDDYVDGQNISVDNPIGIPINWMYSIPDRNEDIFLDLIKEIYPEYPTDNSYNRVSGVWALFSVKHHGMNTPYGKHVENTVYSLRNDEATMGIWLKLNYGAFRVYSEVPYFGPDDTPLKTEEQRIPYYWFHYRHKRNIESVFRSHIGDIPV